MTATTTEGVPATGRDLLKWADDYDRGHKTMLGWLLGVYGHRCGWTGSVTKWTTPQIEAGYRWAMGYIGKA